MWEVRVAEAGSGREVLGFDFGSCDAKMKTGCSDVFFFQELASSTSASESASSESSSSESCETADTNAGIDLMII